jgi:hypothetical protein
LQADAVSSGGGVKGSELARAAKTGYAEWKHVGGTSAGSIAAIALASGHNADSLAEPVSYEASTIDDRQVPFGFDLPISTAASDRDVPRKKGDKEHAAF